MDDPVPESHPDPEPEATAGGRRSRRHLIPWAIATLASVAAGIVFFSVDDSGEDLAAAREVAGRFGTAYLSFDADTVQEAEDELLGLATDTFGREFSDTRLPSVAELFADSDTRTEAQVTDVFASQVVDGGVRAIVFLDVEANAPDGAQQLVNLSFVLDLRRVDGRWRVDGVAPLPIPEVVGDPEGGS